VPAVAQNSSLGEISIRVSKYENCAEVTVKYKNLPEDPTLLGVYGPAAVGVGAAPLLKTLTPPVKRKGLWCSVTRWSALDSSETFTPVILQQMRDGLLYVQVTGTTDFMNRAQVRICAGSN